MNECRNSADIAEFCRRGRSDESGKSEWWQGLVTSFTKKHVCRAPAAIKSAAPSLCPTARSTSICHRQQRTTAVHPTRRFKRCNLRHCLLSNHKPGRRKLAIRDGMAGFRPDRLGFRQLRKPYRPIFLLKESHAQVYCGAGLKQAGIALPCCCSSHINPQSNFEGEATSV